MEKNLDDMNWDVFPSQEDNQKELKQLQNSIRKRNWKIIITSIALATALLVGIVFGAIPFAESLYWSPDDSTYNNYTDLETTLHAYSHLFTPGYNIPTVHYRRTGFASYQLEITQESTARKDYNFTYGTLEKNNLTLHTQLLRPANSNYSFSRRFLPSYTNAYDLASLREILESLPPYIQLEAAVTFPKDLSMEELISFRSEHWDLLITWVAIRAYEPSSEWTPLCGMDPFSGGTLYRSLEKDYPYFNYPDNDDASILEKHFKSLLQYSADQVQKERGIVPYGDETIYPDILEYVEENGVFTYGCVVTASAETLLALLDSGEAYDISLVDAWIDIS